jgi:hypothetical protein
VVRSRAASAAVFSIGRLTRIKVENQRSATLCSLEVRSMRLILFLLLLVVGTVHATGPWRASERNTSGWTYMTPKERLEHQATVRAFSDYETCHVYQLRHHEEMETRAKAAGQTLKPDTRDICEHLRSPQPLRP